jgi:hypothetical protein
VSFGTDIHLSSNAFNQAAVAKDSAGAGWFDHNEARNPLTFLLVAFAFRALAPQFAQEGSEGPGCTKGRSEARADSTKALQRRW